MSEVERQGCDARYLGPSLLAILAAETAPLLRVHILEIRGAIDLQHAARQIRIGLMPQATLRGIRRPTCSSV